MNFPPEIVAVGIVPVPTPAIIADHLPAESIEKGLDLHDLGALRHWAGANLAAGLAHEVKTTYRPNGKLSVSWQSEVEMNDFGEPYEALSLRISGKAVGVPFKIYVKCSGDLGNQHDGEVVALLVALNIITVDAEASEEEQSEQAISAWETMDDDDPAMVGLSSWIDSALECARVVRSVSGTYPEPLKIGG